MGHHLQAFIAEDAIALAMQRARSFPFVARLPFGLSLLPIDDEWLHEEDDRALAGGGGYAALGLPEYPFRGAGDLWMEYVVAKVGFDQLTSRPLLFARTEWFGGTGASQGWLFEPGPRVTLVSVNAGLIALGVTPAAGIDAWDAVGLGEYRASDWDTWRSREARGALVHTRTTLTP